MVPNILQLFGKFWFHETMQRNNIEMNHYATKEVEITYMEDKSMQTMTYTIGGEK